MRTFEDERPLLGQDPFIVNYDNKHYLVESIEESRIAFSLLSGLQSPQRLETTVVWDSPTEHQVWAPELHQIEDYWYIYYAASDGDNRNHRPFVLWSDQFFGPYHFYGMVGPDTWGIDMTIFPYNGVYYAVWSGWEDNGDEFPQHLYVARMRSPWKLATRIRIASPDEDWETSVAPILEGPQAWFVGSKLHLLYSGNASWKQEYSTGMISLVGSNPLNPEHWKKQAKIMSNAGHACMVGDSFVYHRKMSAFPGWTDREIRVMNI